MTTTTQQQDDSNFVDEYLPALLAQASGLLSGDFHRIVVSNGFTVSEWRVLATLCDGQFMPVGRLAEIAVTKQPTLSRVLDRMEVKGYVERVPFEPDRRVTLVRLTNTGRKMAARLVPQAREHERRILDIVGSERAEQLKGTLRCIISSGSLAAPVLCTDPIK